MIDEQLKPDTTEVPPPETLSQDSMSPWDLLASLPGAPTKAKVESWKREVPGGRVKIFSPDGKRVFLLRGISGLELAEVQSRIPENSKNPDYEVQLKGCEKAVLWTNMTVNGKLSAEEFRIGPAGLAESLWVLVQNLSDFYDPVALFKFSMEL